jgi:hypothetical protein
MIPRRYRAPALVVGRTRPGKTTGLWWWTFPSFNNLQKVRRKKNGPAKAGQLWGSAYQIAGQFRRIKNATGKSKFRGGWKKRVPFWEPELAPQFSK